VRIVFAGTPEVALPALDAISGSHHDLLAVLTRPDAARGRSSSLVPSPVAAWAAERGIETLKPASQREPTFRDRLRELAPDCCPVVAYGALIPADVLAMPANGWVNVHFSLLPSWRGAAPVQRAILAGDTEIGITVFDIIPALDAGPVYLQEASPLQEQETAGEVLRRLAGRGAELLVRVLDAIEDGTATATPQASDGVTLAPKLQVADARIDWMASAVQIDKLIRACNPSPVAWTTHRGERVKVLLGHPQAGTVLPAGELAVGRRTVNVGTGRGVLELLTVQPAGKRPMAAADWGRGLGADPGEFQ